MMAQTFNYDTDNNYIVKTIKYPLGLSGCQKKNLNILDIIA